MEDEFNPKTIDDLIQNWERLAKQNLEDKQRFELQGLQKHADQAYGKMIGFRSAINHAEIMKRNS